MSDSRHVPVVFHALAAAFVIACVVAATRAETFYGDAMQEDRAIEWATMVAFACAGVAGLARAIRQRRVFDGLVALFLLFVAGEEMSWGQRILGLTPPAYFLEHNAQQEMNLHNFTNTLGGPRWPFVFVLVGYAIVLPLASYALARRSAFVTRALGRIGATAPPRGAIPWFLVAIALFIWYPFRFTGEWTELLAGSAFLVSMGMSGATLAAVAGGGVLAAVGLTLLSSRGRQDPALLACAEREIGAITSALDASMLGDGGHRRVWSMVQDDRIDADSMRVRLAAVQCAGVAGSDARRRFAADPWGTAYWLRVERGAGDDLVVTLYSFGPNRRRDLESRDEVLRDTGDDVYTRVTLAKQR